MGRMHQKRNLPETAGQKVIITAVPEAAITAVPEAAITEGSEAAATEAPEAAIITIITTITVQGTAAEAEMNSGSRQTRTKPFGLSFLHQN